VGIQANLNSQWNVSVQAAGQKGNNDYRDLNGSFNLRYSW
jgi:outer membrane autotransporter protein